MRRPPGHRAPFSDIFISLPTAAPSCSAPAGTPRAFIAAADGVMQRGQKKKNIYFLQEGRVENRGRKREPVPLLMRTTGQGTAGAAWAAARRRNGRTKRLENTRSAHRCFGEARRRTRTARQRANGHATGLQLNKRDAVSETECRTRRRATRPQIVARKAAAGSRTRHRAPFRRPRNSCSAIPPSRIRQRGQEGQGARQGTALLKSPHGDTRGP